ncbi:MAG: AsmA family protein [Alphaproteobacteria bacterium]|nr:AsmA family protein [Alphaproteobacteria bacterium]
MRQIIKYAFCIFCFLLMLLAASLVYFTYFFSTDSIRKHLAEVLSAKTGYNVQLHQSAHIAFFPQFKASLYSIVLTTPRSAGLAPLMRAEQIDIDLSLIKALQGKLEFSNIKVVKPQFFLSQPVYDIILAAKKIFGPDGIMRKSLTTLTIENGRCENLGDIMAHITFGGLQQKPYIEAQAKFFGQALRLNTHIDVNRGKNIDLPDLLFLLDKFKLHGALQVALLANPTITGSLAIEQLDLQNFIQKLWTNYIMTIGHNKELVNLDLRLSAASAKYKVLEVKNLAVTLQAGIKNLLLTIGNGESQYGRIAGNIKAYKVGQKATIETTLSSAKLDLAPIAKVSSGLVINAQGAVNFQAKSVIDAKQTDDLLGVIFSNMSATANINADTGYLEGYAIPMLADEKKILAQTEQMISYDKKEKYKFSNLKFRAFFTPSLERVDHVILALDSKKIDFSAVKVKAQANDSFLIKGKICTNPGPGSEFILLKTAKIEHFRYIPGSKLPDNYLDKKLQAILSIYAATQLCVK